MREQHRTQTLTVDFKIVKNPNRTKRIRNKVIWIKSLIVLISLMIFTFLDTTFQSQSRIYGNSINNSSKLTGNPNDSNVVVGSEEEEISTTQNSIKKESNSSESTQSLIDQASSNKSAKVLIVQEADTKVPSKVAISDLKLQIPNDNLNYKIDTINNRGDDFVVVSVIVSSSVVGTQEKSYEFKVKGFASEKAKMVSDTQWLIDKAAQSTKAQVSIASGSESKLPSQVELSDLELEDAQDNLIYKLRMISKRGDDFVEAIVGVSSNVLGTSSKYYVAKISGFASQKARVIANAKR